MGKTAALESDGQILEGKFLLKVRAVYMKASRMLDEAGTKAGLSASVGNP
jgi:hypothetical protein